MISRLILNIADFCARHKCKAIVAGTLLLPGSAAFDIARFSINADAQALISERLPWHERQIELDKAFRNQQSLWSSMHPQPKTPKYGR
jgi:uncharacterized protein